MFIARLSADNPDLILINRAVAFASHLVKTDYIGIFARNIRSKCIKINAVFIFKVIIPHMLNIECHNVEFHNRLPRAQHDFFIILSQSAYKVNESLHFSIDKV